VNTSGTFESRLSQGLFVLVCFAGLVVLYIAAGPAPQTAGEEFTELYVLGPNGTAEDYPSDVTPGEEAMLTVGVENHESGSRQYRLVLQWNDSLEVERQLQIAYGATWQRRVEITAPQREGSYRLRILLYRNSQATDESPYRRLYLTVKVGEKGE